MMNNHQLFDHQRTSATFCILQVAIFVFTTSSPCTVNVNAHAVATPAKCMQVSLLAVSSTLKVAKMFLIVRRQYKLHIPKLSTFT